MKLRFDRRRFLRGTFGSLGAIIAARVGWLFPEGRPALTEISKAGLSDVALQPPVEGELYAGFVLLPEDAPVPAMVRPPRLGMPIVCGVGAGKGGPEPNAVNRFFDSVEDLSREVDFPLYTLGKRPEGLRPEGGYTLSYDTGEIFGVSHRFEAQNPQTGLWEAAVGHHDYNCTCVLPLYGDKSGERLLLQLLLGLYQLSRLSASLWI